MKIYCRKINVNKKELTQLKGPLLLAANHPNSFLDAVILDILFKDPIVSLARGDVFKNKWAAKILMKLRILPVYRLREGAENLSENYRTFDTCVEIFKRNGIVLIFSEGLCQNEWHLRPLKKGTARLALQSWKENIDLKILPVGLNYSSHRRFAKSIEINFGKPFSTKDLDLSGNEGMKIQAINNELLTQLQSLVYEIDQDDHKKIEETFDSENKNLKKSILLIPAKIGFILHAPLYRMMQKSLGKRVARSVHSDSIYMFFLMFLYPVFLLLTTLLCWLFTKSSWSLLTPFVLAFSAYAYAQTKNILDHQS